MPASVSVVMPSYRSHQTIARTLEGLRAQRFSDFEVIVVDSSPDDAVAQVVRSGFPEVRFERSQTRLPPHAARNRGAEIATGRSILFTDPDCKGRPDWIARLIARQADGPEIVGGAVEPADRGWVAYGIHLCKFGPWMSGGPPGTRPFVPTANLLLSRSAWEKVGPFSMLGWSGDTELCLRARALGFELHFEPSAVVEHQEELGFTAFWRERVRRGRAFGRLRTREYPLGRVALGAAGLPALPFTLLLRGLRDARSQARLRAALTTVPVQLAGYLAWSLGEARAQADRLLGVG
jgi:GT2 family glycosyltransferase